MIINPAHATNYNYEFDLVQADGHRAAMGTDFSAAPNLCKQTSAGRLSSVEVSSKAIAQIGNFYDTMNAVVVKDFERASKRPGLPALQRRGGVSRKPRSADPTSTSGAGRKVAGLSTVQQFTDGYKEMWNE
jgi:hypothetical protein